jgi:serine phosphatase RsbU (regulator of sigma subunit)
MRVQLPWLVIGTVIACFGLTAIVVACLRWKSKGLFLLSFGLLAGLYGVRLLAHLDAIRVVFIVPSAFWGYLEASITHVINIPGSLFLHQLGGKQWKSIFRWPVWGFTIYGVIAVAVDLALCRPMAAPDPANFFSLLAIAVCFVIALRREAEPVFRGPEAYAVSIGFAVLILFVVREHLRAEGVLFRGTYLEPLGFLALLIGLGYVAMRRFFQNEQRLITVAQEMEAARRIQASILPQRLPDVAGIEIAVRYQPMTAVAGDFYDFVLVDSKRLGILVSDTFGHGVPAALIASMVKVALAAQRPHATDPAKVLSGLNQILCGQAHGQFVTAGYLFIDTESRTAVYGGAGHPPLLLWQHATKQVLSFEENGLVLGFRPDVSYSGVRIPLQPGDRLVLYTDGVIEAMNAAEEFFGAERLQALLRAHTGSSAEQFAVAALQELATWSGRSPARSPDDDITFLAIDVKA